MKKHKDKLKLIAIILLPYLLNLINLSFQCWVMYKQSVSSYNESSSTLYYGMIYDTYSRFLLIAKLLEGAFLALWLYLIYTTKKKSTVIAVLVNLFVLAALVVYTLIEPNKNEQIINILYYILVEQRINYLTYIGMHIFALICLFLSKDQFQEQIQESDSTQETFSLDNEADVPHIEALQEDIIVNKEPLPKQRKNTHAKTVNPAFFDQDDDEWKP